MAETASDPASTFYKNLRLKIMIVDLIGYGAPVFFAIYLTLNFHEKILEIIQNNNIQFVNPKNLVEYFLFCYIY